MSQSNFLNDFNFFVFRFKNPDIYNVFHSENKNVFDTNSFVVFKFKALVRELFNAAFS